MESDEIQFASTQRNQQKLVYRGRCYTLKRTNRNDKCWICASGTRGCPGKRYTNLDATEVIRTGEHAEGCRVDTHAFLHHQQLNELKRLAARDLKPVLEIIDELGSNAFHQSRNCASLSTWEQSPEHDAGRSAAYCRADENRNTCAQFFMLEFADPM
ncbi:hypothetical protein Tsp_09112, partial [Trichinella spiralis]|uniref:hypothetical protein n=1 Tax=Trichinella spiralis TaxID=6334 RepID=UPI0001EFCB61